MQSNILVLLLGILIFSFLVTSIFIIPFINLLYKLKFQRKKQETRDTFGKLTPIFNKFHKKKAGIPIGAGLLVIFVVGFLFAASFSVMKWIGIEITYAYDYQDEINVIFFTFLSYGLLGLYDDIKKFFRVEESGFFGLRMRHKFLLQMILAVIIASMLYLNLGIDFVYIPHFGSIKLGFLYIPYAVLIIMFFANAVNITDGLDGLAGGTLMISLFGLWLISAHIVDMPLSVFIALWLGSLISFLYFNVYPARFLMGDVGALSFGASLAVVGLLLGKTVALFVIGFVFIFEALSSLFQLISKRLFGKKIMPAAPFHLTLQEMGWEEPKIVQRIWLIQIMLTIFGMWLAML